MKLVLISPLGDLNCDIAITDFPYAVGRNCRDFDAKAYCSGLFGAAIAQVSGKHGRFMLEENQVVLEDLGSMNGTTVNGKTITGQKRVLYPGDRVNFAGKLEFIIDIEYPPVELPGGKEFTLHPVSAAAGLDSFQLQALPFLIGRLSPVFRKYDDLIPQSSAPLANRHARIFFKDGAVYIADLGSQSGIFVQG
ncbi:MAG: FHA domain-containing protein, partial [Spirochaetales bacterium]|nr:FHA domain-containing protein [Spirochaetales bacterium]